MRPTPQNATPSLPLLPTTSGPPPPSPLPPSSSLRLGSSSSFSSPPSLRLGRRRSSTSKLFLRNASLGGGGAEDEGWLDPPFLCPSRQSSMIVAIVNLLVTIIGAGQLSLPYAMAKSGWVIGLAQLLASAVSSGFAVYLLCLASRRTGASSFTHLARQCYGEPFEWCVLLVLLLFLVLVLTAFLMLLGETVTAIAEFVAGHQLPDEVKVKVLYGCMWLVLPLCFCRTLHALRHTCYLGVLAMVVLMSAIGYRAVTTDMQQPERLHSIRAFPSKENWTDPLLVSPIFVLSFLCTFNMLPVQASLVRPTRQRVKHTVAWSIGGTLAIYLVIAFGGYFYALDGTKDDILSNFSSSDELLMAARVGLAGTLYFSIPVILLPARQAALDVSGMTWLTLQRLYDSVCSSSSGYGDSSAMGERQHLVLPIVHEGDEEDDEDDEKDNTESGTPYYGTTTTIITPRPATSTTSLATTEEASSSSGSINNNQQYPYYGGVDSIINNTPSSGWGAGEEEEEEEEGGEPSRAAALMYWPNHSIGATSDGAVEEEEAAVAVFKLVVTTCVIIGAAAWLAARAPGVMFVWSVSGSSMGFFIGFTLPALYYIKVTPPPAPSSHPATRWTRRFAVVMLVVSIMAILSCTLVTVTTLSAALPPPPLL